MGYIMKISYEIRTMRDARIFCYDNLVRAREGALEAQKRVGVPFKIVKVTQTEEVVS